MYNQGIIMLFDNAERNAVGWGGNAWFRQEPPLAYFGHNQS